MNTEIIRTLTPKEYISAFLSKDIRTDRRNLKEKRKFSYQFGILDTFSTSASCLLGDGNKIIAVVKSHNKEHSLLSSDCDCDNFINVVVENFADPNLTTSTSINPYTNKTNFSESNMLNFVHKLIENNLELELPSPMKFALHITIINSDGNVNDCIAHLIQNLFSGHLTKENECSLSRYIKIKKNFTSNTFCVVEDKLLLDPSADEVSVSNYYFSILKFGEDEYIVHKIKGDAIATALLEEAFSLC